MNSDAPQGRSDRRKARTRAALVGAAQTFLAQGNTSVSIQEITSAADVGFGSFYNHFATKVELFAAAMEETIRAWSALRDEAVAGLQDPAEIFARSFRMTGRLQRIHPELVRVILRGGTSVLVTDQGLRPRAFSDIVTGIEQGRFTMPDSEMAVMAAGGSLLGMLQLLDARPELDDAAVADIFAERTLVMLGVDPGEAREIATSDLPAMPSFG